MSSFEEDPGVTDTDYAQLTSATLADAPQFAREIPDRTCAFAILDETPAFATA